MLGLQDKREHERLVHVAIEETLARRALAAHGGGLLRGAVEEALAAYLGGRGPGGNAAAEAGWPTAAARAHRLMGELRAAAPGATESEIIEQALGDLLARLEPGGSGACGPVPEHGAAPERTAKAEIMERAPGDPLAGRGPGGRAAPAAGGEYALPWATEVEVLEGRVNRLMAEGYEPSGPAFWFEGAVAQPMLRRRAGGG